MGSETLRFGLLKLSVRLCVADVLCFLSSDRRWCGSSRFCSVFMLRAASSTT